MFVLTFLFQAIFLGMGSSLKQKLVEPFENIELHNLFAGCLRN